MNAVSTILDRKGNSTISVPPTTSVLEALRIMAEENIGSVVVMENKKVFGNHD